ncbi:hypothetical protein [Nitrincola tapanii]|nr:hypothetical protein [Nitrincola tapanii]
MTLWIRTLRVMLYDLLVAAASGAPSVWAESKKEMHLGVLN